MEKKKWTEERIREEFRKLDNKTRLHGADLPIKFGNAKYTLGTFYSKKKEPLGFRFSRYYFDDPEWPEAAALDVIRHEYAHYMDLETYGNLGHGKTWKICCSQVGARPVRLYDEKYAEHKRRSELFELHQNEIDDGYKHVKIIVHPVFGEGVVQKIECNGKNKRVIVNFQRIGVKQLGLRWVEQNCTIQETM